MLTLENKKIIVTGASSGIGRQIAITLAELGATLLLLGRNDRMLDESMDLLKPNPHQKFIIDLTDNLKIKEFIRSIESVDGVIFNAGIVEYLPVKFIKPETLKKIFDTNFNSVVFLTQELLKNKLVKSKGSLIYISSISSKLGVPGTAAYACSKAALNAFAKVVASEVSNLSIRANVICPGIVITEMTQIAKDLISADKMVEAEKQYPLGYGEPKDVAGLVAYLSSDFSKWMTGSELILDGGYSLV